MVNETNLTEMLGTFDMASSTFIELPFYRWLFCFKNNCLKVWVIGLIILVFILFGIIMYKLRKRKKKS